MSNTDFINSLIPGAVETYHRTGVLPSITIAQAIHESGWGASTLAKMYNNLFGIKGIGPAGTVELPTWEVYGGKKENVLANFRVYNTPAESILDHANLLMKDNYAAVRQATDYKTAAYALYQGGYATDPQYPEKIINIISSNRLYEIDQQYVGGGEGGRNPMTPSYAVIQTGDDFNNKVIKPMYEFFSPLVDGAATLLDPETYTKTIAVVLGGVVLVVGLIWLVR